MDEEKTAPPIAKQSNARNGGVNARNADIALSIVTGRPSKNIAAHRNTDGRKAEDRLIDSIAQQPVQESEAFLANVRQCMKDMLTMAEGELRLKHARFVRERAAIELMRGGRRTR